MTSADKADRNKARAEARFRMDRGASAALAEGKQREVAEREKTARLRALRLARDAAQAPNAETKPVKKSGIKTSAPRGVGG